MKKEKKKLARLLIITLVVLLPIAALLLIGESLPYIYAIGLIATEEPRTMECWEHESYVKSDWVENDTIDNFEDLSEEERMNLSTNTKRRLKTKNIYLRTNVTDFQNLSEEQRDAFQRASDRRTEVSAEGVVQGNVYYMDSIYWCEIDIDEDI